MTKILYVDDNSLSEAKRIITSGGVIAFPTETVYGLGANAFDSQAVNSIFAIKGRPNDNPLIVHVHKDYDITELVSDIPEYAVKLAKAFLPGPLTMVYKSKGTVSSAVSCGLDTLAIRIPSHPIAQRFLEYVNLPVAAPSANISRHVSPTSAEHVYADLKDKVEIILDGGRCSGGIESTVLDCTGEIPVILRSGLVTREDIASVTGNCGLFEYREGIVARSPGMKYKHYSPDCKTLLFSVNELGEALKHYEEETKKGLKVYFLADETVSLKLKDKNVLSLGKTAEDIATNLYEKLREGEKVADLIIAVAPESADGIMVGVMNRLTKACKS